ncbi:MAG: hypothetical protein JOZ17_11465 [Acetobacteraceae bacterium]|nr:hypothetical protein [Acetobacteraceae bacterium]
MSDDFLERLSKQIAAMRTDLVEHIDHLQNAIGELRDEVAVNFRAGERIDRARTEIARGAAAEREEHTRTITERVAEIEQQIRRLDARVAALESKG